MTSPLKVVLAFGLFLCPGWIQAQTFNYSNTTNGSTTQWSTGTGWDAVPVSASNTILNFGGGALGDTSTVTSNNDLVGSFSLNQLNFTYSGPAGGTAPVVNLSGNPLNFVTNVGTPTLTLNSTGTIKPLLNISANVILGNNLGVTATTAGTISGVMSGAGNLTKTGTATLSLSNANSFSGSTIVNAGTLSITNSSALGSTTGGTSVATNATLRLQSGVNVTGEALSITGDGASSLGALRNESGTNIWGGTVSVGAANTRVVINSGNLKLGGGVILTGTSAHLFVLQGDGVGSVDGIISGNGSVTRSSMGTGVWTLAGNNTYTGLTTVSNGTILVNGSHTGGDNYSVTGGAGSTPTLGGTGSITLTDRNVVIGGNGRLSPGDSVNPTDDLTLSLGTGSLNISLINTASLLFDLGSTADSDLALLSSGTLTIGTGVLNFNDFTFQTVAGFGAGVYTLFDTNSAISGTLGGSLTGTIGGLGSTLSISGDDLILTVVPEPSSALMIGAAGLLGLAIRRRR